jgi:hypothetical protein
MNIIEKKSWNFTLTELKDGYLFSVVCGSVGIYEIEFILNQVEKDKYLKFGIDYLEELAEYVRKEPNKYLERQEQKTSK